MRTRAILLTAAFAIIVIASSAVVTSHFGMRDWPTPPMPDTATRLITPTEAAGRTGDRMTGGDVDHSSVSTAALRTRKAPAGARARGGERRRSAPRRGATARRDSGGSRPNGRRDASTRDNGDRGRGTTPPPADGPATPAPNGTPPAPAPTPAPAAAVTGAGSRDDEVQARLHEDPSFVPATPVIPLPGSETSAVGDDGRKRPGRDLVGTLLYDAVAGHRPLVP